MLRITLYGSSTQWMIPANGWPKYPMVGWESVALLLPGPDPAQFTVGSPPSPVNPNTGLEETNEFGDNGVWHTNFGGDISLTAEIDGLTRHNAGWLDVPCIYTADNVETSFVKPGAQYDQVGSYHRYHRVKYVGGLSEMYDFSRSVIMTTCGFVSSLNTTLAQTTWGYVVCDSQYVILGPIVNSFNCELADIERAEREMESMMYEAIVNWDSLQKSVMIPVHFPRSSDARFSPVQAQIDLEALYQNLKRATYLDEAELDTYSRISQTAIAAAKDDTGENLQTVFEFGRMLAKGLTHSGRAELSEDLFGSFSALLTGFGNMSASEVAKAASGLYLGSKWGTPLTVKEMSRLLTTLASNITNCKFPVRKLRGRSDVPCHMAGCHADVGVECTRSLLCYYETNDNRVPKLVKKLFDVNLLSFSNLYDFIPYSFVFDWLTNFGSAIETYDSLLYRAAFLNVRGTIRTERISWRVPASKLVDYKTFRHWDVSGDLTITRYRRELRDTLPLPTVTFSSDLSASHIFDGAVLALQRT